MKDWKFEAERWKKGNPVWSVELGGIGPGYEQTIQILLWEILVRTDEKIDSNDFIDPDGGYSERYLKFVNSIASELDKQCLGFTGAQVGVAKQTAFQFIKYGYNSMMEKCPKDRKIYVMKAFPRAPE